MRPDPSKLGANVGFGYLTDDDDDGSGGGAPPSGFDALVNAGLVSTASVGATVSFQIDATATTGAQTSGSIRVSISGVSLSSTPLTTALAGWSETGWSLSAGEWFNTLTKSSVSVGTTSPTFSCVPSATGTLTITTNYGGTHAPHTAEATGGGNSRSVTIGATYTLAFTCTPSPGTISNLGTLTWDVLVSVGGAAQSNIYGKFYLQDSLGSDVTLNSGPGTIDTNGFTLTWTNFGDGLYYGEIARASCPAGDYHVQFSIVPYKHAHPSVGIAWSSAPLSDQVNPASYANTYVAFV